MLKNLLCPMLVCFYLVACVQKPTLSIIQKDAMSITILDEANEGSWDVAYEHCRKQGTTNGLLKQTEIDKETGFKLKTPSFKVDGHTVWGATAMMIAELREVFENISLER